jgi:hypothetical protein
VGEREKCHPSCGSVGEYVGDVVGWLDGDVVGAALGISTQNFWSPHGETPFQERVAVPSAPFGPAWTLTYVPTLATGLVIVIVLPLSV